MKRIINALKKYGVLSVFVKIFKKILFKAYCTLDIIDNKVLSLRSKIIKKLFVFDYAYIKKLCANPKYKNVFIFFPYYEWNVPVFQRPQQIALSLSKRDDILYLFCSGNFHHDYYMRLYKKINDNLYVITDYAFIKNLDIKNKILHLYSTDMTSKYEEVEDFISAGNKVLYEYIDEIHESISGNIPKWYVEKHNKILGNPEVFVIATADKLLDDVKNIRKGNFALSTNGVNIEDFIPKSTVIHKKIKAIKMKYKKIVCYYGSLAVWFDYKLLIKCAKQYPEYAFVLIGMEYDGSLKESGVLSVGNILYLGKMDYSELIKITKDVDLLTIPFLINEVTESTSPVKLFEYMATRKPILTTGMRECKKYSSVVTSDNDEDFVRKIKTAMELINDENYIAAEWEEANQNTWDSKSEVILALINNE